MAAEAQVPWYREMTRYQWTVLIVAWLGWVFDVFDTALFNFAKAPMLKQMIGEEAYKLQGPALEGRIQMLFLIGWAVGGLIFGIAADRWGRTRTLTLTILLYCLFTGLTALCQTPEQVMGIRFLTAIGIGGEWAAGAALLAEVVPNRARAGAAALLQSAAAFGPWLAAITALLLKNSPWQTLFWIGVLPALLTVWIRFSVKEPERWQAARAVDKGHAFSTLRDVFGHMTWRRHALVALVLGLVGIAGAGNVAFWLPNLVNGVSQGMAQSDITARTSYATLIMHSGTMLGVLAFPWLAEKIGRRPAFFAFFVASPVAIALATWGGGSYERLIWLAPVMAFFAIGLSAGFALYFPELFPTRLRATGAGFAYNTGRILAAPIPELTGRLIGSAKGSAAEGVLRAASLYVVGLVALAFAPETKGKPLPEEDEPTQPSQ